MKNDIFFVREKKSTNVHIHKLKRLLLSKALEALQVVAPKLLHKKLSQIMYYPSRYKPKAFESEFFEKYAKTSLLYVDTLRIKIKIYRFGHGPKIILQHGWASSAYQLTSLIKILMQSGFEVIAVDQPGHGDSEGSETSYFDFIKASEAIKKHVGEVYGLIGHSLGSASTVYLSTKYENKLKVVLLAPHYNVKENLLAWTAEAGVPREITEKIIEKKLVEYNLNYKQISPSSLIKKTNHDIFVVHDIDDMWVSFKNAMDVVKDYPKARLLQTKNLGHNKILKDENVLREINSFMQNQEVHHDSYSTNC